VGSEVGSEEGTADGRLEDSSLGRTDGSELDRPLGPSEGAAEATTLVLTDTGEAVVGAAEGSLNVLGAGD
jgi:hypothetical protein